MRNTLRFNFDVTRATENEIKVRLQTLHIIIPNVNRRSNVDISIYISHTFVPHIDSEHPKAEQPEML
jgi:hypothetical protein